MIDSFFPDRPTKEVAELYLGVQRQLQDQQLELTDNRKTVITLAIMLDDLARRVLSKTSVGEYLKKGDSTVHREKSSLTIIGDDLVLARFGTTTPLYKRFLTDMPYPDRFDRILEISSNNQLHFVGTHTEEESKAEIESLIDEKEIGPRRPQSIYYADQNGRAAKILWLSPAIEDPRIRLGAAQSYVVSIMDAEELNLVVEATRGLIGISEGMLKNK